MTSKDTDVSVRVTEFPECREINAHAHTVRTRPSPAFWEGPGYEARRGLGVRLKSVELSCPRGAPLLVAQFKGMASSGSEV